MESSDQEIAVSIGRGPLDVLQHAQTAGQQDYNYGRALTGDLIGAIQVAGRQPHQQRRHSGPARQDDRPSLLPAAESRIGLRVNWNAARAAAEAMVQAAVSKDMAGLGIAADDLDQALSKLWHLRANRDVNWQTILNHVQGMMRQFFARKQVEEMTLEQCQRVLTIVLDHLGTATKSVEDLNEAVRLIEDAGFDPFAEISGDPSENGTVQ